MAGIEKKISLGKGEEISFRIPEELVKEFGKDLRVVIRHPWVVGIPVPERLLKLEALKGLLKDFDVVITPKQLKK
ncbi:MAG: hypothetical protein M1610_06930 [Nitrospirae bacterium]|jgi:hypothetical protein|nr:hypothetical protein [Nitrospirota bacterium]MDA8213890.1 hypothetical protein [Nitrospiraceae bacterium]MDA8338588.1 hypothetical protein [Nitrospiraceae bacterium]MDI6728275.1 hypothetical protein [Thermodesulfovibrionales bacterium]